MADVTHFDRLGLPRRFALAADEVEANYLSRSRAVHPDFHQLASSAEQRASMELTAALNEAYTTLRDPFRRADYLLTLEGGPTASDHKQMAPDFLEEMLELREEIEELRQAGEQGTEARGRFEQDLRDRLRRMTDTLAARFGTYDSLSPADPKRPPLLRQVRETLNAARYIQGLLRDLRAD